MDELKYEKVGEANSRGEAEVIESFLIGGTGFQPVV